MDNLTFIQLKMIIKKASEKQIVVIRSMLRSPTSFTVDEIKDLKLYLHARVGALWFDSLPILKNKVAVPLPCVGKNISGSPFEHETQSVLPFPASIFKNRRDKEK
jgi:hypothetical protein